MNVQKTHHTETNFQNIFIFSVLKWKNDSNEDKYCFQHCDVFVLADIFLAILNNS